VKLNRYQPFSVVHTSDVVGAVEARWKLLLVLETPDVMMPATVLAKLLTV
jgi:hypothetical protein